MSIATEITRITGAKAALKTAINGKGGTVTDAMLLDAYAAQVDALSGVGAEIEAGVVVNDNGALKYQPLSFSGTTASNNGTAQTLGDVSIYNTGKDEPDYVGSGSSSSALASLIDRSITSITIPDGVTSIGHNCFYACSYLTSITIPDGVTSIGHNCFYACSYLTSITIPSSVTSIGHYCFYGCTSLASITIPDGVTSIGSGCFVGCTALTDIYCGFSEGAVSGAPWGAPETTTIHYNSTGA